jgi:rhomboid protease GluP
MTNDWTQHPLEFILRQCAAAAPAPWYPSVYAREAGISRDDLDPHLDRLRMGGLIHLTDWVQGTGQGYALTLEGEQVVANPQALAQLRNGKVEDWSPPRREAARAEEEDQAIVERARAIEDALRDAGPPLVTYGLIFLNIFVFLGGLVLAAREQVPLGDYLALERGNPLQVKLQPKVRQIQRAFGAISGKDIERGEWWRLLACCFVHFGLAHLVGNMFMLWIVGPRLEQVWGHVRFLILYLIAGIAGSCGIVINNPESFGAGASGALWGILTSLAAWILLNRRFLGHSFASDWLRRLLFLFVLNAALSMMPGISAAAHFVGGAAGVIAAGLLNAQRFGRGLGRGLATLGIVALPIVCVGAVLVAQRVDPRWEALDYEYRRLLPSQEAERESSQTYQANVQPFLEDKLKVLTFSEAQQGIEGLGDTRGHLEAALDAMHREPYHLKEVEEERQKRIEMLQNKIRLCDTMALADFAAPLAEDALRQAARAYEDAELDAQRKLGLSMLTEAAAAAKADLLEKQETNLEEVASLVKQLTPSSAENLAKARQALLDDLEAEAQLMGLAAKKLRQGKRWTGEEERELEQQERRVRQLNPGRK